ncbi:hypothetical protein ABZW32_19360 [Streptomyces sp. NPDC004667]|uniref:hypothetical protein n=1 Tax=Streptomyces sp. NPDC004667 TaxID=3154285 RepID=UPI0033A50750
MVSLPDSRSEISELVEDIFTRPEVGDHRRVEFHYFTPRGDSYRLESSLIMDLNVVSGHGRFTWWCDAAVSESIKSSSGSDIGWDVWVSCADELMPEVVVYRDLHEKSRADVRTVLSPDVVRSVVEEFCGEGNGFRPTDAGWMRGHMNGHVDDDC